MQSDALLKFFFTIKKFFAKIQLSEGKAKQKMKFFVFIPEQKDLRPPVFLCYSVLPLLIHPIMFLIFIHLFYGIAECGAVHLMEVHLKEVAQ